jgi:hypothetical protein
MNIAMRVRMNDVGAENGEFAIFPLSFNEG